MVNNVKAKTQFAKLLVPPEIRYLFGGPSLLPGEDSEHYNRLFSAFATAVDPKDLVEWMWTRDIADCTWEIERIHRWKTAIVHAGSTKVRLELFNQVLEPTASPLEISKKAAEANAQYASGDPTVVASMRGIMRQQGYDDDSITAEAFARKIDIFEVIEKMVARAFDRRDQLLRDIERRRSKLATKLSHVIEAERRSPETSSNHHVKAIR